MSDNISYLPMYNPVPLVGDDDYYCITGERIPTPTGQWTDCPSDGSDCVDCEYRVYKPSGPTTIGGSGDWVQS
jgi:hypothetical protein